MDKELEEKLKKYFMELADIHIKDDQIEMFKTYMNFLIDYNTHTNLTSIVDPDQIIIKHFLDSVLINRFIKISKVKNIIDIGTGAGFPGLPIKICFPDIKLTLLDSLNKRIVFLKKLCEKLNLHADIVHSRAEDLSRETSYREKFDLVVSRAVAPLNILSEYCMPYVKKGGIFVSYKGPKVQEEMPNKSNYVEILGGKIQGLKKVVLPESGEMRNLVFIEKVDDCDIKYPRPHSKIKKHPL